MLARAVKIALVALHCIGGDVFKDGVATQLATDIRLDDERVGFAFADAKLRDVVLDVLLGVIVVAGIVELSAARCF